MRHRKSFNHLGRTSSHRKAMLSNMAASLILHKRINTTLAKAKALRTYVEPLITKSKDDSTHNRRVVFSYLQNKEAVTELFREISQKIANRPGGYTRIFKTGLRLGDNAEMCLMELVDYNESYGSETKETKAKTSRRRKSSAAKAKTGEKPASPKAAITVQKEEKTPVIEEQTAVVEENTPVAVENTEVIAEESNETTPEPEPEKPEEESKA